MNTPLRVLIVEDSENDALLLERELRRAGFAVISHRVDTAADMADALASQTWDLILADYMMPSFNGIAALEQLKESGLDIPFIIVSGSIGEDKAVAAMKAGAHDYLMKSSLKRLASAIGRELEDAVVRRERKQALQALRRNLERINALHEINLAIISTLDLRAVLQILLDKIELVLPALATTVKLFNAGTGELERVACHNLDTGAGNTADSPPAELTRSVLQNKAPLVIADAQMDPRTAASEFFRKHAVSSYLGVPLIVKDQTLGLISFFTRAGHSLAADEIEFLTTLANQAAIAIHNARLYQQIKNQMIELEKSNKVKDEFLSVMSHELRTPLNVTMGYTGLLKDGALGSINAAQERALDKVTTQSSHLLKMVNSILYATSLEAETVNVNLSQVNLVKLIGELEADYTVPSDKNIAISWEFDRALPVLHTDAAKLKSILDNLIDNAIKFTESGHVAVAARYVAGSRSMELEISDTGVGIAEEKLPIIFEMFRQIDSSETRPYGGVGLGLFIVKKFTEMLGGRVEVVSAPNRGSTFKITLPDARHVAPQQLSLEAAAPVDSDRAPKID